MRPVKLLESLPQHAYEAKQLLQNEAVIAKKLGIDTMTLMECAGLAIFDHIRSYYPGKTRLVIICGKGNNGGDGLVVARLAKKAGVDVNLILCADPKELKGEAAQAYKAMENQNIIPEHVIDGRKSSVSPANALTQCLLECAEKISTTVIVDCLFGIGFCGELADQYFDLVETINGSQCSVVSVDVPSGLNANTGEVVSNAVIADSTVTMIAVKRGLTTGQAASHIGQLFLAELSVGQRFNEDIACKVSIQGQGSLPKLQPRPASSHKGHIGSILAIGGNQGMPGAIRLAAEAGLRSGAALMAVCCHPLCQPLVFSGRPEIMLAPSSADMLNESHILQKATALVVGPGLGQDQWAMALFNLVMKQLSATPTHLKRSKQGVVIDADGLRLLSQSPHHNSHWILTPHVGEAAQLLDCSVEQIEADRFAAVQAIVDKYGGICVLKGAGTLICDGKSIWVNTSGNAGMASGGMGDVLSGIIAALWLQCDDALSAVRLGVYFHGKAADHVAKNQGLRGMLASDLFPYIQQLVNE